MAHAVLSCGGAMNTCLPERCARECERESKDREGANRNQTASESSLETLLRERLDAGVEIFVSGRVSISLQQKGGRSVGWRLRKKISNSDSLCTDGFFALPDKSTMNLFVIDSLDKLREYKLGANLNQNQK